MLLMLEVRVSAQQMLQVLALLEAPGLFPVCSKPSQARLCPLSSTRGQQADRLRRCQLGRSRNKMFRKRPGEGIGGCRASS